MWHQHIVIWPDHVSCVFATSKLQVTMGKLRDYAEVCFGFKGIQHLDDVFMLKISQDFYLLS